MRFALIIFLLTSFMPLTGVLAQDVYLKPNTESVLPQDKTTLANRYFANCMAKDHPIMSGETKEMLCACTSARISEEMEAADIQQLFQDTPEGKLQRDRVLAYIYLPCMKQPSYDLILDNCVNTLEQTPTLKNAYSICQCLANEMAQYTQEFTDDLVRRGMSAEELSQVQGKLAAFLNGNTYQQVSQQKIMQCLKEFQ